MEPKQCSAKMIGRRARAFHEAGHAVAAWRLGFEITSVSIVPDHQHGGRVMWRWPKEPADLAGSARIRFWEALFVANATMTAAGPVAQRFACPRSKVLAGARDDEGDLHLIAAIICRSVASERAFRRYVHAEAKALVKNDWHLVSAITTELLEREALTGAEAVAIIEQCNVAAAAEHAAAIRQMREAGTIPTTGEVVVHQVNRKRRSRPITKADAAQAALAFVTANMDRFDPAEIAKFAGFTPEGLAKDEGAVASKLRALADRQAPPQRRVQPEEDGIRVLH